MKGGREGGREGGGGALAHPMKEKARSSCSSKGKSGLKLVLKMAVMVSSSLKKTEVSLKRNAPHTAPKKPRQ